MIKYLICSILFFTAFNSKADVIISIAVKQNYTDVNTTNTSTTITKQTTVTNNCSKSGKNCTSTTTNAPDKATSAYSYSVSEYSNADAGVLMQYVSSANLVIGIGAFQDNSGMITLGYRFK